MLDENLTIAKINLAKWQMEIQVQFCIANFFYLAGNILSNAKKINSPFSIDV